MESEKKNFQLFIALLLLALAGLYLALIADE